MSPDPLPPERPNKEPTVAELAEEFRTLLRLAQTGDQAACTRLYREYQPAVLRAVRRRMNQTLRKIYDSIDLAQEVWSSLFAQALARQEFAGPEHFLRFVTGIACHKAEEMYRRDCQTQKRSLNREEPMGRHEGQVMARPAGEDPAERAADEDEWARLLAGLPERERGILEGLRAGGSLEEMARRFDLSAKQLRRVVGRAATGWGLAPLAGVLTPSSR